MYKDDSLTTEHSEQCKVKVCEQCGLEFYPERWRHSEKNRLKFCSVACKNENAKGKPVKANELAWCPEATSRQKVAANGLINMRLRRLPESFKPTICVHCGKSKRLDAHHTDYSKPDYVVWVCRSCHMKAHRDKNLNESLCQHLSYVPTLGEYEASSDFHLYRRLAKKAGAK